MRTLPRGLLVACLLSPALISAARAQSVAQVRDSILRARDSLSRLEVDGFVARWHTGADGVRMPYRLFVPPGYDPARRYPLIVWLHGGGGGGTDNRAQILGDQTAGTHLWTTAEVQARHPAFVLVPQTVNAWHVVQDTALAPGQPLHQVMAILSALQREFSLDSTRLYAAGQSIGGGGVWGLLTATPNPFAAALIICPHVNSAGSSASVRPDVSRAGRAAAAATWIFQGSADGRIVNTRAMLDALRERGASPRYTEYAGMGHDIWDRALREPGLADWLFAQRRPR